MNDEMAEKVANLVLQKLLQGVQRPPEAAQPAPRKRGRPRKVDAQIAPVAPVEAAPRPRGRPKQTPESRPDLPRVEKVPTASLLAGEKPRTRRPIDLSSATCPRCGRTATGITEVQRQFGYKVVTLVSGRIEKPQSHCRDCRSKGALGVERIPR